MARCYWCRKPSGEKGSHTGCFTTIAPVQDTHIGELLKQARKEMGLTQAEAAAKVGVSQGVLSQHESGSDMRVATLISYCRVYGIKQLPVGRILAANP